jgi:hypothetical protein
MDTLKRARIKALAMMHVAEAKYGIDVVVDPNDTERVEVMRTVGKSKGMVGSMHCFRVNVVMLYALREVLFDAMTSDGPSDSLPSTPPRT